ncbi:PREDICTED: BRCA1-A complex subunit BRE [Brassica oleracea var. oleracea]|uniref:BRISC and BRCA1-A complex member 2 n=1 Tax=Brassica oleracea var. oleracea TaxID=109376 RepID=A0A0D3BUP7_BRAOL|nr:PREDICTED: BRCA1-A complex subunit BRE [Brassica oleracea var. oleracea]
MAFEAFPPLIADQLHYLLNHSSDSIKIENVRSGNRFNPRILDRFTLVIPYCLDAIKWDVIYNSEYPSAPPDFIFGPDDEDFMPCSSTIAPVDSLLDKALSEWNNQDSTLLLVLIQGLRDQYVAYQRKRVGQVDDDRVKFEISTVLTRKRIEMQMTSGADKPEEVKFAVPLVMDMSVNKLVVGCPWKNEQKIYLQVVYPILRKYESAPSSPRLKLVSSSDLKALFSVVDVKLPPWMDGMCLAEYLPHLEETLERQILEAVSAIVVRRSFVEALTLFLGRPLEADPTFCRKASFLATSGPFPFVVHFFFPTQFPKQQPALMLQSCQHLNQLSEPVKLNLLTDYPWSPRWEVGRMAERLCDFLTDEAVNFKKYCNEALLQH